MKKLILLICFLFINNFVKAQCSYKYIPFPQSGGKWHVYEDERLYDGTHNSFEGNYFQNGDTIINSIKYSVISRNGIDLSFGLTINEMVGFMRQDTGLRTVYFKPLNSSEYTLYDFSNKSLLSGYVENSLSYYSTDMGGVVMNNGVHRYLRLAPTSFIINAFAAVDSNKIAIEGIGSENGLINNLFGETEVSPLGSWRYKYSKLISFSINDTVIYSSQNNFPFTFSNLIPSKVQYVNTCLHQPYLFYGDTIFNEGSYYHIQKSNCDTLIVLNIRHKKKVVYDSSTFFKPYIFNNKQLYAAGTYYDTIQSISGCDSLIELHLSRYFLTQINLFISLCKGDSINLNGQIINKVPFGFNDTLQNLFGRDSAIIHYSINAPYQHIHNSIVNLPAGVCTYFPYGHLINHSGIYDFITNVNGGCDSIDRMDIRFKNGSSSQTITLTHCSLGYNFNGKLLTTAGIYFDTLTNIYGCDSISILKLYFHKKSTTQTQNFQICKGDTLKIGKYNHVNQGTYIDTLSDYLGCDSIVRVSITYSYPKYSSIYNVIYLNPCDSFFLYNGRKIKYIDYYKNKNNTNQNVTWFNDTIHSPFGCSYDSIIKYKIYFIQPSINLIKTIPLGSFYNFYGQHLYQSGNYSKIFQTPCGTDSIVYLNLDVRADYHFLIDTSVFRCKLPYHFYGNLLSQEGSFFDTLTSQIGVDSIVLLNLKVFDTIDTWIDTSNFCQDSILIGNVYYYQTGWNYKQTFSSYKGCDSTIHININSFFAPLKISLGKDQVIHGVPITINMYTSENVDTFFCNNGDTIVYPNKSITFYTAGTYIVRAIVSWRGCVDYDTVVISYPQGYMETKSESIFILSPNPTANELKISTSKVISKIEIENILGQIIFTQLINNSSNQSISIDVSALAQGIYLLKCTDENGLVQQVKFVKQ